MATKQPTGLPETPQLSPKDLPALMASTLFWRGKRLGQKGILLEAQAGVSESYAPLFFVGYEKTIAENLDPRFPIYIFPGGIIPQDPTTYIAALAKCYVEEILSVQSTGPYFLGGYCFGGLVAFEMAQQLQAQGHEVAWLTIIDIGCPTLRYLKYRSTVVSFCRTYYKVLGRHIDHMVKRWSFHIKQLSQRHPFNWPSYLFKRAPATREPIASKMQKTSEQPKDTKASSFRKSKRVELWQALKLAIQSYQPRPYSGKVELAFSTDFMRNAMKYPGGTVVRDPIFFPTADWDKIVSEKVSVHHVPGDHASILDLPNIQTLAQSLNRSLSMMHS
ncbi:MAG: thioesterase domain-containing protein [Cyanobacteria bacterium P01_F01_bin.53]